MFFHCALVYFIPDLATYETVINILAVFNYTILANFRVEGSPRSNNYYFVTIVMKILVWTKFSIYFHTFFCCIKIFCKIFSTILI